MWPKLLLIFWQNKTHLLKHVEWYLNILYKGPLFVDLL